MGAIDGPSEGPRDDAKDGPREGPSEAPFAWALREHSPAGHIQTEPQAQRSTRLWTCHEKASSWLPKTYECIGFCLHWGIFGGTCGGLNSFFLNKKDNEFKKTQKPSGFRTIFSPYADPDLPAVPGPA